jgi:Asp/Glu/hydantoin racemase
MDKPLILVVNPNTSQDMTAAIDRVAQAAAGSSANVVTIRSQNGPYTIEGALDAALATAGMLEVVAGPPARYAALAAAMGLSQQFVGTYQTPLSVADFESDDPAVLETLLSHAEQAVKDGADCLLFGCAGIADQVHDIEARVGVTCVASAAAGVSQAIACLRHRRVSIAGGPFRRIKTKPLAGFEALQPHYQGR